MIALIASPAAAGAHEAAATTLRDLSGNGALPSARCARGAALSHAHSRAPAAEGKIAIAAAGGIRPLIALLHSPIAGVKAAAAAALGNLSLNGASPCAGVLRGMWRPADCPVRRRARAAENKIAIAAAGGIPPLIELIRSHDSRAHEAGARTLQGLSINGAFPRAAASHGLPPALLW